MSHRRAVCAQRSQFETRSHLAGRCECAELSLVAAGRMAPLCADVEISFTVRRGSNPNMKSRASTGLSLYDASASSDHDVSCTAVPNLVGVRSPKGCCRGHGQGSTAAKRRSLENSSCYPSPDLTSVRCERTVDTSAGGQASVS